LISVLVSAAAGSGLSQAQNQQTPQAQRDAAEAQREAAREGQANDRLNNDPDLNNDQSPRRAGGPADDDRAAALHRAHPHAAARCHDGFFTTTRDRRRACTRHGGIDVWLGG
jgi:hypothetical protein